VRVPPDLPRRIVLVGVTGSGKSTLAARISEATGLPWTSTDQLIWEPGWHLVDQPEQVRRVRAVVTGDRWVLDSAPSAAADLLHSRADLVVALDYPRWLSLQRLVRRTVRRVVTREKVCNGNTEGVRQALGRDSILAWHFRTFTERRNRIQALLADRTGPPVVRLTSQRATDAWLRALRERCTAPLS
jgi:adenylate kinase family enzyme